MKLYKFSDWLCSDNELFSVTEIEVEEKPKTYMYKHTRVLKDEINTLLGVCGHEMYCLENDPQLFINAKIEKSKRIIEKLEKDLIKEKSNLSKWQSALESEVKE